MKRKTTRRNNNSNDISTRSLHADSWHGSTRLVIQLTSRQLPAHIMSCSHDYRNETQLSRTCIICRMRHATKPLLLLLQPFPSSATLQNFIPYSRILLATSWSSDKDTLIRRSWIQRKLLSILLECSKVRIVNLFRVLFKEISLSGFGGRNSLINISSQ